MGIRIPDLLNGILEATAAEAAAKARITTLRAALEDEARRRFAADGAAPSWAAPQLGKVRLDPPSEWAAEVADPAAFGSYVAQHYPTEATALIAIAAPDLEDVLKALEFIGVTPTESRIEVRPAWSATYLEGLAVDVEEQTDDEGGVDRAITVVDPDTGVLVDGLTAGRKPAKLVVSLDRDRRTAAVEEAKAIANALLTDAAGEDAPEVDLVELDARRRELEGLHGDQLAAIAKARELGSSGTKAALAERIARVELATGHVIRPAATVEAPEPGRVVTLEEAARKAAGHRIPYVGDGADGARRSAQIDREEADGMDPGEDRDARLASADRWDAQAAQLEATDAGSYTGSVGEASDKAILAAEVEEAPAYVSHAERKAKLADEVADARTREELRRIARAKGVNPGGTKLELANRLVDTGAITAEDLSA